MDWLNYHHLFYFWTVVREGGVSKASKVLRLAQPTVSGQIKALENALGEKLFERQGRSLVLTDVGQVVFRYADEIFSLGRELQDTLKGRPVARPRRLVVGVSDSLEKRVAHRLLAPALESGGAGAAGGPGGAARAAGRRARRPRAGPGPLRRAGTLAGEGLQPPARRVRGWALRPSGAGPEARAGVPEVDGGGAPADRQRTARRCSARWPTGSRPGASAPGWSASSRTAR